LNVSLSGSASGGTAPYTYDWQFGDGNVGTGQTTSDNYVTTGTFTATLTVIDSLGNTGVAHKTVLVTGPSYYADSTNGNDSNNGLTPATAFKTLAKCQTAMQGSSTKTCTVRGQPTAGIYLLTTNLSFGSADNGETWVAYFNETPVIDGNSNTYHVTASSSNFSMYGFTFQNMLVHGYSWFAANAGPYTFRWNTFLNCGANCFGIAGLKNSLLDSNTFNGQTNGNVSGNLQFFSAIAFGSGSSSNTVSHNLCEHLAGGCTQQSDGSGTSSNNNIVSYNLAIDVLKTCIDCGVYYGYTAGSAPTGNQFLYNIAINGGNAYNSGKCFYLDNGFSNVLIQGNTCVDSSYTDTNYCISNGQSSCNSNANFGIFYHTGGNNKVINNIFESHDTAAYSDYWGNRMNGIYVGSYQGSASGDMFNNNIVFSPSGWPNPLWFGQGGTPPTASTNDYWSAAGTPIANYGVTDGNPKFVDPMFKNPAANDFSIPTNSPVYSAINWQPIPGGQGPVDSPFSAN